MYLLQERLRRSRSSPHSAPLSPVQPAVTMPLQYELCPGRMVGGDHPCFIIAEIGQNHQGDLEIAKKMIHVKECGADCAKFQKSQLEHKFNKKALERPYTSPHSWGKTYGEHKRHLEFSHDQYRELQKFAKEIGIYFTASGMDEMAVEFLHEFEVPFFKVGSGDTNNLPYIKKTAQKGRPMVISSGMQSMDTMRRVYELVKPINPNFCFLQCTSAYPLLPEDSNLRIIQEFKSVFPDIPIGYSGHESGIAVTVAAVAMGAKVVEHHVTLDKTWKGTDHQASLEPNELADLVKSIRLVEKSMGSPVKRLLPCEMACLNKLGKSVVAKTKIPAGTVISLNMLTVKVAEPRGFPPEEIFDLEGKTVKRDIEEDESVTEEAIENYNTRTKC
ncbi:LOW QUALITY PROTEIN: N-acetylneuraminate-9-phosphate synthase-like [Anomaloglossus baeobatrachus]